MLLQMGFLGLHVIFFFFFFKHYLIINSVNKYLSTFYVPDIVRDAESIKVNRTQNPAQIEFKI